MSKTSFQMLMACALFAASQCSASESETQHLFFYHLRNSAEIAFSGVQRAFQPVGSIIEKIFTGKELSSCEYAQLPEISLASPITRMYTMVDFISDYNTCDPTSTMSAAWKSFLRENSLAITLVKALKGYLDAHADDARNTYAHEMLREEIATFVKVLNQCSQRFVEFDAL